jgi:hypothetical protein
VILVSLVRLAVSGVIPRVRLSQPKVVIVPTSTTQKLDSDSVKKS